MTADEMTAEEVDAFLRDRGSGVLALTDGAESYAIPESFGYDGDALYFQLVHEEESRKMALVESTDVATLTAYTETPAASVVARGPLDVVSDGDALLASEALAENGTVPTLNVSTETPPSELAFDYYRLTPDDLTGRVFGPSFEDGTER